jgi:hypothetical protein
MLVLTLAGVGRGLAAASDMTVTGFGIPGVAFYICHTGEGGGSAPADQSHHDCCDDCALLAPVTSADAPSMSGPASVMHYVEHTHAMAWVPTIARLRTPRQSQGPPTA